MLWSLDMTSAALDTMLMLTHHILVPSPRVGGPNHTCLGSVHSIA